MWGQVSRGLTLSRLAAVLTRALVGERLYPRSALEIANGVVPTDLAIDYGVPERFGAVGDGVTVDTAAVQAAIDSGHPVRGRRGSNYRVGPLAQSVASQVVDFTGSTLTRVNASPHAAMLTLSGQGAKVIGGRWDGNKAGQAGAVVDQYAHAAVLLAAAYTEARELESVNSWGIGVKGVDYAALRVQGCRLLDSELYGVYMESLTADVDAWVVTDNLIESTAIDAASGIYITGSDAPFTFKPYHWIIERNICRGSTGTPTGIGITTRGADGVLAGNIVTGFTMGISADTAIRTVISGNKCSSMAGATGYGIELNGGYNAVTGNVTRGGVYGIVISGAHGPQPHNTIAANYVENPSSDGIYVNAGSNSARYLAVVGNTVQLNGAATGRTAVRLAGDCRGAHISGNQLVGPGQGIASCRAVFLDGVGSRVSITGNRITGWERPVGLYAAAGLAYSDVTFSLNDLTEDNVADPANFLQLDGAATFGDRIVQMWNNSANAVRTNYLDRQAARILNWSDTYATPEGNVAAAIGSLYVNFNGGAGTTLFVKQSGAGNTGWAGK